MPLDIQTYSNVKGGNSLFKALGHPAAASLGHALVRRLEQGGPVAVYDPAGFASGLAAFYDLSRIVIAGTYVQAVTEVGRAVLGQAAAPVSELPATAARTLFVALFDADRAIDIIRHLLPAGMAVVSLDAMRLDPTWLTNQRTYLDTLNFATNFAFFRDAGGLHTRLVSANYWSGYGAGAIHLALILFGTDGSVLAEWQEPVRGTQASIVLDSREVRARFGLGDFTGQLFIHAVGAHGHDVVKYALDTFGDDGRDLSCTHDANAWPADLYAGLPAPAPGERVVLWMQNSHPVAMAPGAVGLSVMGGDRVVPIDVALAPFATTSVDLGALFPGRAWPDQFELHAGKHFVRPRYEVTGGGKGAGRRRIAHANVERTDLKPDPRIAELGNLMGKGYLLPAPILPRRLWRSEALPTPMATTQQVLPVAALLHDRAGRLVGRHDFGRLARNQSVSLDLDPLIEDEWGHVELVYDFAHGNEADGWLHGIFRYEDRGSGHAAETTFGAHIFNTVLTYKDEPQSYAGRPPGLSTRLFLRLGADGFGTICHLIYPASTPWHERSATDLILHDRHGAEIARERIAIPCSGSVFFRHEEMFDRAARRRAGADSYVVVRDKTCRLFGYHGLSGQDGAFSLDHMFGF